MAALAIGGYTFLVFFASYVVVRVCNVIKPRLLTFSSSTTTSSSLPQPASAGRASSFSLSALLRLLSKTRSPNVKSIPPNDSRWFWQRWRHPFHHPSLPFAPLHLAETELLPTVMPPSASAAVSTFTNIPIQNQHSLIDLPLISSTPPPRQTQNVLSSTPRLQSNGLESPVPMHLRMLTRSSSSDALPSYRPLTPTPIPASNRVSGKSPLVLIDAGTASQGEDQEGIPLVPITPPKFQRTYTMKPAIDSNGKAAGLPTPPLTGTFSQPDLTSTTANVSPFKPSPLHRSSSANSAFVVTQHDAASNDTNPSTSPVMTTTPRIIRSTPETRSASPTPNLFTSPFLSSGTIPQALSLSPRSLSQYQYSNTLAYQQQHRRSRSLNGVPVKKVEKPEGWEKVFEDREEGSRGVENSSIMSRNIEDSGFDLGKGDSLIRKDREEGKLTIPAPEKKALEKQDQNRATERRASSTVMSRTASAGSSVYSSDIGRPSFSPSTPSTASAYGPTHFTAIVPKPIPLVDLENLEEEEDEKEKATPINMFDAWKMRQSGWGPYGFDFDTFGEDKTVGNEESGRLDVNVSVHRVLLDLASPVHAEVSYDEVERGEEPSLIDLEPNGGSSDAPRIDTKSLVEREKWKDMDTEELNAISGIQQSRYPEERGQKSMSAVEEDLLSISVPSSPSPQRNILPLPMLVPSSPSLSAPEKAEVTLTERTPVIASAPVKVIAVTPAISHDETLCDDNTGDQIPGSHQEQRSAVIDGLILVPVSGQAPVLHVQTPTPPASPPREGRMLPNRKEAKNGNGSGSTSASESETSPVERPPVDDLNFETMQGGLDAEEEETEVNMISSPQVIQLVEVQYIEGERQQSFRDDEVAAQNADELSDGMQSSSDSSDIYPHQRSSSLSASFSTSSLSPVNPETVVILLDRGLTASPESLSIPLPPGHEREKTDRHEGVKSEADPEEVDGHEGADDVDVFVVPPSPTLSARGWDYTDIGDPGSEEDERDDTVVKGFDLEITPASPCVDKGFGGNASGWDYGSDDEDDGYDNGSDAGEDLVMQVPGIGGQPDNGIDEDDSGLPVHVFTVNTEIGFEPESVLKEAEPQTTPSSEGHLSESPSERCTSLPGSFPDVAPTSIPHNSSDSTSELRQRRARPSRTPIEEAAIRTRSPLEFALAMQLRPGFGVGADPAWMVRFLMVMWGWVFGMLAGDV